MLNEKDEEWGNLSLPGMTHDELINPNLNYVLANLARNKDINWLNKQKQIYKNPKFKKLISQLSKEKWSDPEFQSKQHIARILAWANADERRKQVSQWAKQTKTTSHRKKMSESQKQFYKTLEGKKVLETKAAKQKGQIRPKFTCPYCGSIGGPVMKRYHFDNCRNKKPI